MTTTALHPIDEFAAAVRAALSDLPADEVEDLTDGLEADLAERTADQPSAELGDPRAYADELRSAAGLPARSGVTGTLTAGKVFNAAFRDVASGLREVYDHPAVRKVASFLLVLRPVWWLYRGAAVALLVVLMLGRNNFLSVVVVIAACILSVQLGRQKRLKHQWARVLLALVNVGVVVTLPIVLTWGTVSLGGSQAYAESTATEDLSSAGLTYDGNQVSNIFAYDANGNPLTNVQLFDQSGRPLSIVSNPNGTKLSEVDLPNGDVEYLVPSLQVPGRVGWNVYPLSSIAASDVTDSGSPRQDATPVPANPRAATVPGLAGGSVAPTAGPTPAPTPAPSPKK